MTAQLVTFYILSALLLASSALVVFKRSVVHSAMALVAALFLMAILFITLQAPMVGVLQILVYAGAIMVLFLFVIMFLNPTALEQRRGGWWAFGTFAAALLAAVLIRISVGGQTRADPVA